MSDEAGGDARAKWQELPSPVPRESWIEESDAEPVPGSLDDADVRLAQVQIDFYGFNPRG